MPRKRFTVLPSFHSRPEKITAPQFLPLLLGFAVLLGCQPNSTGSSNSTHPQRVNDPSPPNSASKLVSGESRSTDLAGELVNQEPTNPPRTTSKEPGVLPLTSSPALSQALFDGQTLSGWKITSFGGEGDCRVTEGVIVLEAGFPLTGVTSTRDDLPTNDYEILIEARKTNGIDFFCGLTFPVHDTHCSLIVGGWAGSVVGLSLLDNEDAAHNETRRLMRFKLNQWYVIRLRVEGSAIKAWIDDEIMVDQDISDRQLSVRNETLPSRPLGICSFETKAEIRKIELKRLR